MEPHPIPQDILNTEFKLFGSFTLKQFLKLLMGCLVALLFFLTNLPAPIKWPLVGTSLLIGVSLAIVPRFGTWLVNYLKAIFISPRYVWVQSEKQPELLMGRSKAVIEQDQKVTTAAKKNDRKVNLEEISLEKLLAARDNPRKSTPLLKSIIEDDEVSPRQNNLDRVLNEVYKDSPTKVQSAPVAPKVEPIQQAHVPNAARKLTTKQDYVNEISNLKQQLSRLVHDQNYKDKESEILYKINELMQSMNVGIPANPLKNRVNNTPPVAVQQTQISNFQGEIQVDGQYVFGVVVDKSDKPVSQAKVIFDDEGGNRDILAVTDNDGKFATQNKLAKGFIYNIGIDHPSLKFHNYKINVGDSKLPMYKLRAK